MPVELAPEPSDDVRDFALQQRDGRRSHGDVVSEQS